MIDDGIYVYGRSENQYRANQQHDQRCDVSASQPARLDAFVDGSTGAVESAYTYSPYGATEAHTGTATTPLGYDRQYTSADTGLIYLRARVYDLATAQFMSADPALPITRAPYTYANDNPLNLSDPSGLSVLGDLESARGGSTQVCAGGTVSLGVTVSLEGCYVHTPHGEGITIAPSVGFGAGVAVNGHFGIGESNACHPSEYGGLFNQTGGSAEFGTGGYYNRFSSFPYNEFSGAKRVEGWTTGGCRLGRRGWGRNLGHRGDPARWRRFRIIGVRMQLEAA